MNDFNREAIFAATILLLKCLLIYTTLRLLDSSVTIASPLSLKGSPLQLQSLEPTTEAIAQRNFPIMTSESSDFVQGPAVNEFSARLHVDLDGTCRIYYCCMDHRDTSDRDLRKMAEVRNIEFHFQLQPDDLNDRSVDLYLPSMSQFTGVCPIWLFTDGGDTAPKPTCNIITAFHGTGKVPDDYQVMLHQLLCLTKHLTLSGYEEVSVKVVAGTFGIGGKRRLPSDLAMTEVRRLFEQNMGTAEVVGEGEVSRLQFRPRAFRIACLEKQNGERSAWAAYINDPKKRERQQKANVGSRNLFKWF